jgi:hypothetical protein
MFVTDQRSKKLIELLIHLFSNYFNLPTSYLYAVIYIVYYFQVGGPSGSLMLDHVDSKQILHWIDFRQFLCHVMSLSIQTSHVCCVVTSQTYGCIDADLV